MKASRFTIAAILIVVLSIAGCNMPASQPVTPNAYTAAALTVTALAGTEAAGTPQPTATLFATFPPPTIASTANTNTSAPPSAPQASSTPSGTSFVTDVGANCRTGPGTNYDKIASFAQGAFILLVGRNSDSTWWLLKSGNINCWISATTGHTSGPVGNIPVVQAPPSPTAGVTGTVTSYP